jgi:hypothetical protein
MGSDSQHERSNVAAHPRLLSYTEVETAMSCWARWDFAYGGRLTGGDTLKKREAAVGLSRGRAWGAAVATWHAHAGELLAGFEAHAALQQALAADAREASERGLPVDTGEWLEAQDQLGQVLDHHMATVEPLPNLTMLEGEFTVPIPARSGSGRSSTKYRFQCYVDGFTDDGLGWHIVEFKLRGNLTDAWLLELQRQQRWYAWALAKTYNTRIAGVIMDETLLTPPAPARIVNAKRKSEGINGKTVSHAKDQVTTPEKYVDACHEFGVVPDLETVQALTRRVWHQRFPLDFRPDELEEAGNELRDAGKLITMLDSGELHPVRNAKRATCGFCKFKTICANPTDHLVVDQEFVRTVPKRLREPKVEA